MRAQAKSAMGRSLATMEEDERLVHDCDLDITVFGKNTYLQLRGAPPH